LEIQRDRVHIWWKYLCISSYIRKTFLIYDFALDPIWISLNKRKFLFLFYQSTSLILVSLDLSWPTWTYMLLCCRYEQLGKTGSAERAEQHRRTLRQALHVWLDQFPEDFCEPPNFPCLSHLGTDQIISSSSPYFCDPSFLWFFLWLFTSFLVCLCTTNVFTFFIYQI
jgi:hypothetical protein